MENISRPGWEMSPCVPLYLFVSPAGEWIIQFMNNLTKTRGQTQLSNFFLHNGEDRGQVGHDIGFRQRKIGSWMISFRNKLTSPVRSGGCPRSSPSPSCLRFSPRPGSFCSVMSCLLLLIVHVINQTDPHTTHPLCRNDVIIISEGTKFRTGRQFDKKIFQYSVKENICCLAEMWVVECLGTGHTGPCLQVSKTKWRNCPGSCKATS